MLKKKINPLFVIFISVAFNLLLTAMLVINYTNMAAVVNEINQLQKANLQLELIILKAQGINLAPKPAPNPTII